MAVSFADPLVELQCVCFQYPSSNPKAMRGDVIHRTISDISFSLCGGDRVLVIGHNGSGKSTLLSLVSGRRKATQGKVTVLGCDAFENTRIQQHVSFVGEPWSAQAFFGTTVDKLTSPAPDDERRKRVASTLNLSLQQSVERMSTGQRRRVQILHGMLQKSHVYLLDECSTDMDVAERKAVLDHIRAECAALNGCCMYATHILDGIGDWATHVMFVRNGSVAEFKKFSEITEPLELFAHRFLSRSLGTSCNSVAFSCDLSKISAAGGAEGVQDFHSSNSTCVTGERNPVIVCKELKFRDIFNGLSFEVYRGERVLLCGCSGSGKSTLLNMMGGAQFFDNSNGALRILGKVCYDDMSLNASVSLAGNWWTSPPPCEICVREMVPVDSPRVKYLCGLLAINLDWDVRHLSAGEQKRVQLLHRLHEERPVVLLDEATSDLDLDMRHALLLFLYRESVYRGITVIYVTHIFGGLQEWPTVVMLLDRRRRGLHAVWRRDKNAAVECTVAMERLVEELITLKSQERAVP